MATQNNLHVPAELLDQAQRLARSQGRTADDLAADALERYLAHELLNQLARNGENYRRDLGLKTDEDVERFVNKVIADSREERRGR